MAKRKSRRKQKSAPGKRLLCVLSLAVAVIFAYGPAESWWQRLHGENLAGMPPTEASLSAPPGKGKRAATPPSRSTEAKEGLPTAGGRLELPARLRGVPEQILHRKGYTVSYNRDLKLPNWVAWELNRDKLVEREGRTDRFLPDPDLPESQAVTTDDYKRSGWDRGHMCPAGDNRWHWKAMQESFYMTNICPQDHNLNRGDWKELEEDCRRWAQREGKVYIACGPVLYRQPHRTIGRKHKVAVPEAFFKVVLSTAGTRPKAIGFVYPNAAGNHKPAYYARSVDEVERLTGIDFFPALPDGVEKQVEASFDLEAWE